MITHLENKTKQILPEHITNRTVCRQMNQHINVSSLGLYTQLMYSLASKPTLLSMASELILLPYSLAHLANINRSVAENFDN